jgi:hypothetical protein
LVLPVAVWVLGMVSPPSKGLTFEYVATYTLLLAAIALVDQTTPPSRHQASRSLSESGRTSGWTGSRQKDILLREAESQ